MKSSLDADTPVQKPLAQDSPAHSSSPEVLVKDTPLHRAAFIVVLLWGLGEGRPFILPLLIAGLLAFLMAPLQRVLSQRLKVPELLSIVISALGLLSPIVLISYLLVRQGQSLVEDLPSLIRSAQLEVSHFLDLPSFRRFKLQEIDIGRLIQQFSSSAGKGLGLVVGGLATLMNMGSQGVLIFVFSILMLASRKHLRNCAELILAQSHFFESPKMLNEIVELVQRFLIARMLIVLFIGSLSFAVLTVFHVQYSLFLGALLGATTLIPAIGFILGLIPTLIVAGVTGHSLISLVIILGALVICNLIDNYYLTPKLVGNRVNISALASFVGLFAGGLLWGVIGMFLSIPILGVLRIAFSATPGLHPWGKLLSDDADVETSPIRKLENEAKSRAA